MSSFIAQDPWHGLRRFTTARIALGRTGGSLPTRELLAFAHDHALARDAVHAPFDGAKLADAFRAVGGEVIELASAAPDRATYLRRPDLGRKLSDASRECLAARVHGTCDLVLLVSDGLAALAAERQAPPLVAILQPKLAAAGWRVGPVCVVRHARVALMDEVGAALHAQLALILLGERPGLGTADSLGAYLAFAPGPGRTNADRNCVSNIRTEGLPPAAAAERIFSLLTAARRAQLSGVTLKDDSGPALA